MSKKSRRAARKAARIPKAKPPIVISDSVLMGASRRPDLTDGASLFRLPPPPPRTVPAGKTAALAQDSQIGQINVWAAGSGLGGVGVFAGAPTFLGYPELSVLATLPEYRRMAEVLATECTRKWITLQCTDENDSSKHQKLAELRDELDRLDLRGAFRRLIEQDAFFGRAHLYLDTGDSDDRAELVKPIGNGVDELSRAKFAGRTGFLRGVKTVEAVWSYPAYYNATDPLADDWYNPQTWFVQGKEVHSTRLLRFIGREVPDLFKPTYMFGGVSLSQLMKPYVDRWLSSVQAVSRLITNFSVRGIKTSLDILVAPNNGAAITNRAALFNTTSSNDGLMMVDKESEEFFNITTPLTSLEELLAKMQENMCSISGEPVVKLLGIQPAGMNASSQGELDSWRDWVSAFQEKFCTPHLRTILNFVQLSLWGEVDDSITYAFEPIEEMNDKEMAEISLIEAQRDAAYIEASVLSPSDVRRRLTADPESPYMGLDVGEDIDDTDGDGDSDMPDLSSLIGQIGASTPRDDRLDRGRAPKDGEPPRAREPEARVSDPEARRPARNRPRA